MSKEPLPGMARELMKHLELLTRRFLLPVETADLSRSEVALLRFLDDSGPSTMSDISSGLGLALSSTTGVVDVLVDEKLVRRTRSETDRRQVVVALTPRGSRMHDSFIKARTKMGVAMLEPLSGTERDRLLTLFRKMTTNEDSEDPRG